MDKAFYQKNNLHVTMHTHRDVHTKKLWRALLISHREPTVPIIAQGRVSHRAFEGKESK